MPVRQSASSRLRPSFTEFDYGLELGRYRVGQFAGDAGDRFADRQAGSYAAHDLIDRLRELREEFACPLAAHDVDPHVRQHHARDQAARYRSDRRHAEEEHERDGGDRDSKAEPDILRQRDVAAGARQTRLQQLSPGQLVPQPLIHLLAPRALLATPDGRGDVRIERVRREYADAAEPAAEARIAAVDDAGRDRDSEAGEGEGGPGENQARHHIYFWEGRHSMASRRSLSTP